LKFTQSLAFIQVKPTLGLPFGGNLPYMRGGVDNVKLVQSQAILRYIGRQFGLLGTDHWTMM
jgi:hypothetical protein